jgi:hypothetical protein
MSGDEGERPQLTVGSLLGVPLGTPGSPAGGAEIGAETAAASPTVPPERAAPGQPLTAEERPWSVAEGVLRERGEGPQFLPDGLEALTYENVFGQSIEQVWFDGKLVYALDLGAVDVEAERVKVAQEYQIVYAVALDDAGHPTAEPETVPGQLNIYDSVPGMEKYSPIWQFNYVVVPADYQTNTLRSENDCLRSGYPVQRSRVFEN